MLPLAACKVGPDFATPKAEVAPQWLEASNSAVHTDHSQDKPWWTVFQDKTLDNLVDVAYRQNLSLQAAGARVLQARAVLGVAVGEFYPQTQQIGASPTYNQASQTDPSSNLANALGNYWHGSLNARIDWEIDLWGKLRRGVASADAAYLSTIASYDDVLVTLIADVAADYIGIRTLEARLAIAQENVVKQQTALRIARDQFHFGTNTALDVYQAENVLAQTQSTIPQLTAELQQGKDALCVLLGMTPNKLDTLLSGNKAIPVPPKQIAVGMPADLLRRRPDIRIAELNAAAQSEQIGMAKADLFPAFYLSGFFGTSAADTGRNKLNDVFSANAIQFAFGPSFTWPVLNYGQITNNVRVQDAKLQNLLLTYQNTVLSAQKEVENGMASYLQGGQQVALLQKSVTAAAGALRIGMEQYILGTRDFTTVLTAEQNLYQAQTNLAQAQGSYANSLVSLYRALGGGWEIREGNDVVSDAVRNEMRARTNWGSILPAAGKADTQNQLPGLPGPENRGPDVRAPEW